MLKMTFYPTKSVFLAILLLLLTITSALANNLIIIKPLKASWYSIDSLKKEGTWRTSNGVMANDKRFQDEGLTCACRLYPLGSRLRITNLNNGKTVIVRVTDRIGRRFSKIRIDLSKGAFSRISSLEKGIIPITAQRLACAGRAI